LQFWKTAGQVDRSLPRRLRAEPIMVVHRAWTTGELCKTHVEQTRSSQRRAPRSSWAASGDMPWVTGRGDVGWRGPGKAEGS